MEWMGLFSSNVYQIERFNKKDLLKEVLKVGIDECYIDS